MKKAVMAGAAALALSAVGVSGALAGTGEPIKSTISIAVKSHDVTGKVKSVAPDCSAGRKVKVTHTTPSGDKEVVGTTKTDDAGKYAVGISEPVEGTYKAKAKRLETEIVGTRVTCAPAKATEEVG